MEIEYGGVEAPRSPLGIERANGRSLLLPEKGRARWKVSRRLLVQIFAAGIFVVLVVSLISCASRAQPVQRSIPSVCRDSPRKPHQIRNVVFMIPDGMGPYYVKLTKGAMKLLGHDDDSMTLDRIIHGSVRTGSLSPEVTDSAAAATAYATGARTFNQNVSVINGKLMPTVLEGAEGVGMWTGLVTTARITHATPAAFSAHVSDRNKENDIAEQQLEQGIELLMGGGRQHFLPKGESGSKREDDRDMEAYAREKGYNLIHTEEELHSAMIPALGLFSPSHMAFEMDRERLRTEQPSLAQMTRRALQLLAAAPDGFFLMVEGGRIDHAGHMNDPVAAVHEVLAYDEAVAEVLKFAAWDNSTLVISAADHETGGLFQGENEFPDYAALAGISSSMEALADEFHRAVRAVGKPDEEAAARKVLRMAGVPDANLTSEEVSSLIEVADEVGIEYLEGGLPLKLGEAISRVLHVNWTTSHHTDVDVSLGVFGGESLRIKNNIDNSELGDAVIEALRVDPWKGHSFTHGSSSEDDCNLA